MTKEITKAFILQEMQDRFGLRDLEPDVFRFSETVVPVYNVEQHIQKWRTQYAEMSITSAAAFLFFTVPPTEKWHLTLYDVVFMGAGAYKVTGVYVQRSGQWNIYLDMTAAQAVSYHISLNVPVVLGPGDRLYILVDDYTSTQNLRLYINYMEEKLR